MTFELDGYVDVRARIRMFYDRYPDGRLVTSAPALLPGRDDMIYCITHAYRTPDDPTPTSGMAAELCKGATTFTRNSELMNLETSSVGRAIANMGIGIETAIASKQEVQRAKAPKVKEEPLPAAAQAVQDAVDAWGLPMPPEPEPEGGPMCVHGERTFKTGTSKNGKGWSAFMCPVKECDPLWA